MLMGAIIFDRLIKTRTIKRGVFLIMIMAAVMNLILVRELVEDIRAKTAPLGKIIGRIREGIEEGDITPRSRIVIPDTLPLFLPSLCWNEDMGRFFRGTYQWAFSREEIFCFTPFIRDADWVVDIDRLDYRRKNSGDQGLFPQRLISPRYQEWVESLDHDDQE